VAFAVPSDTAGVIHVVGRSSLDTREQDGCDCGNQRYSKYARRSFSITFLSPGTGSFSAVRWNLPPTWWPTSPLFTARATAGARPARIDCMVGAALAMMAYNGTDKVSHHKEKVTDMIHRAETLYGCSLAASYEGKPMPSGTYFIDPVLANASKIHEGKEMAEATRLMIDIAGGFVADLPSDRDFDNPRSAPS